MKMAILLEKIFFESNKGGLVNSISPPLFQGRASLRLLFFR